MANNRTSETIRIAFLPDGRVTRATCGQRLIDIARAAGVGIAADCGGKGKCGKCRVWFESDSVPVGTLSEPLPEEKKLLPQNANVRFCRLACRTRVYKNVTVIVPSESRADDDSLRKPAAPYAIPIQPAVSKITFTPEPQSASKPAQPFMNRVEVALSKNIDCETKGPSLAVMREFSQEFGSSRCEVLTATLFKRNEILHLQPGDHPGLYGIALDIGTTAVGSFLCDLATGRVIASATAINPQRTYGTDVISRIAHVQKTPSSLRDMQDVLAETINNLIHKNAQTAGISKEDIVDMVAVGNPTMQHLFLGLNPLSIGEAPHLPLCYEGGEVEARDLKLNVSSAARVHMLPMLSGFVGGDTMAALLTGSPEDFRGVKLMVDVGTNGELVLSNNGDLTATSCATGPAFEGAQIECGMLAAPGAIEKVWIDKDTGAVSCQVIGSHDGHGSQKPIGLCGSGVISTVAALVSAGIITESGAFDQGAAHPGLRKNPNSGMSEMVLVPDRESRTGRDIIITQNDIRAVQLGKAALVAGAAILMEEAGVTRLDKIFLAGTFGNYLDPDDLVVIGMLSPLQRERIEPIGNAAGDGARLALFNFEKCQEAIDLAKRIRVLELSMRPDFQEVFLSSM